MIVCGVPGCRRPGRWHGFCAEHRAQELDARAVAILATLAEADDCPYCGAFDAGGEACPDCLAGGAD